jgi:hypothetical protein
MINPGALINLISLDKKINTLFIFYIFFFLLRMDFDAINFSIKINSEYLIKRRGGNILQEKSSTSCRLFYLACMWPYVCTNMLSIYYACPWKCFYRQACVVLRSMFRKVIQWLAWMLFKSGTRHLTSSLKRRLYIISDPLSNYTWKVMVIFNYLLIFEILTKIIIRFSFILLIMFEFQSYKTRENTRNNLLIIWKCKCLINYFIGKDLISSCKNNFNIIDCLKKKNDERLFLVHVWR